MANYYCTIRTNYFHVQDPDKFKQLMDRVYGSEDTVECWEEKDSDGKSVFAFGCYGGIAGLRDATNDEDDDCDETAYDEFISELQKNVINNDAIIILESGNEKMRYVVGSATIITQNSVEYLDITHLAIKKAAEMLGVTCFRTQCDY